MKLEKINVSAFSKICPLILVCTGLGSCTLDYKKNTQNKISYDDLVNNYKIVEFISDDKRNVHIVKKKCLDDEQNIYGYYDILYNKCIVKVDEDDGFIVNAKIMTEIHEKRISYYLDKYEINGRYFSVDDLGYMIERIRNDEEKVLVK